MDFDYVEDSRPNLRLQSGGAGAGAGAPGGEDLIVDRKHAGICIAVGLLLLIISAWFQAAGLLQVIVIWLAFSLFLGPFAPGSVTAGDCRVGQGEVLAPLLISNVDPAEAEKKSARSRRRIHRAPELVELDKPVEVLKREPAQNGGPVNKGLDGEWTEGEFSMLKKQLAKNPRGTARRWQVIAESFNGSRTVEEVINAAKDFGSRKPGDGDAYSKFLAQRKVSSKQIASDATLRKEFEGGGVDEAGADSNANGGSSSSWSDAEDKALLGALKTFPKDSAMRWERVSGEVGGKSKAQCLKRYSELRDAFRSSKGGAAQ